MKKAKWLTAAILAVFMLVALTGSVGAGTTFKLAHCVKPDPKGPYQATSLKFKELVEEGTEGRVNIKIFPQRQLGDDRAILEGVRDGIIELGLVTMGPIGAFDPVVDLFELPFLFKSREHIDAVLEGPIGQRLLKMSDTSGLVGLGYSFDGISNITNNQHPLKKVSDFKGVQMRVIEAPVRIATIKALGGNPIPVAYGELYTALKTGVVHGQSNPNWVITARSLHEVQDYVSITQHIVAPTMLFSSPDTLAKLSEADQKVLREAAVEAGRYGRNVYYDSEEEHLKKAIENGMEVERNPDIEGMMAATASVYDEFFKKHAEVKPIVEQIQELGKQF